MISNYCSDYLEDLVGTHEEDMRLPKINSQRIRQSVKFRLPDSGIILDVVNSNNIRIDDIKAKMPGVVSHVKLPYDQVALEYVMHNPEDRDKKTHLIILATNTEDGITFNLIARTIKNGVNNWTDFKIGGMIDADFDVRYGLIDGDTSPEEGGDVVIFYNAYVILCFIAALECSNVVEETKLAPTKLNKSRVKKGKEPLFDYKVLTLDTKSKAVNNNGDTNTERTHTKREHLRRGHIRRYEHKTIWINPCVVGDKIKGSLKKDYLVT